MASIGLADMRGRRPGPTQAGWLGLVCARDPHMEAVSPVPGVTGPLVTGSLGVAEKMFRLPEDVSEMIAQFAHFSVCGRGFAFILRTTTWSRSRSC